jgi:hypothetical protein
MNTLQAIDTIGSWKLGGIYTDESAANTQLRLLNLLNIARQKVLFNYYMAFKNLPNVCYQDFDLDINWTDEGCTSFNASIPTIMTFPQPKVNGIDGVFPICECAIGLSEVQSEQELRQFRNHSKMKHVRSDGWYLLNNNTMTGFLRPQVKATGLTVRAIISRPQDAPAFNIDIDDYPMPDDMFSDVKKVLESDEGRRYMSRVDHVSNSKLDLENDGRSR